MRLSKYAPQFLKQARAYQQLSRDRRVRRFRRQTARARPLNVVIGAGPTQFSGWFPTDKEILNIASADDWRDLFEPESIDRILAEHVLEHLSDDECRTSLQQCYHYLKTGGLLRVAVPDGYRRDAAYVAEASPPKDGHQALYNVDSLTQLLQDVGFSVLPLEYFDAEEQFHQIPWDVNDGYVQRSVRFDSQVDFQRGDLFYTSVIVDARKV